MGVRAIFMFSFGSFFAREKYIDCYEAVSYTHLGERHFEILWRYESATNSIVIQMDKRDRHQRHGLVRKVMFDDFHRIRSNQFEFVMVRFLNEMAQELEYRIKVAPEPMKGEDND